MKRYKLRLESDPNLRYEWMKSHIVGNWNGLSLQYSDRIQYWVIEFIDVSDAMWVWIVWE